MRERTACMMRVKNEARWIRRSLDRTFQVCQTVVIFDDGSADDTAQESVTSLGEHATVCRLPWGWTGEGERAEGRCVLHFLYSPFTSNVRPQCRVSEIRDKNTLWWFCQANVDFDYMLCLDGDEWLSLDAVRHWPDAIAMMAQGVDLVLLPFVYLWDREDQQRWDGLYGPGQDINKTLCFPRLFTWQRVRRQEQFDMRFAWSGTQGGFHCGSIPQENFLVNESRAEPQRGTFSHLIVHAGYIDASMRRAKYEFYNTVDPGNLFEGQYAHCIGEPDRWCPGPVQLAPYRDAVENENMLLIVIPSRTDEYLNRLLESIDNSEPVLDRVVVVDSGLSEACRARWKACGVFFTPARLPFVFSQALNDGACMAEAAIGCGDFLFLGDDTEIVTPGFFTEIRSVLKMPDLERFGLMSLRIQGGCGNEEQQDVLPGTLVAETRRTVCFIAVVVRQAVWVQVGALDERFTGYGHDDDDYCRRIRLAGWKVGISGMATVNHGFPPYPHSASYARYHADTLSEDYARNRQLFLEKYGPEAWNPVTGAQES